MIFKRLLVCSLHVCIRIELLTFFNVRFSDRHERFSADLNGLRSSFAFK